MREMLVALLVLCGTPTLSRLSGGEQFRVERLVMARGVEDGLPVQVTDTFVADEALLWVWFGGRAAARDTKIEMSCTRAGSDRFAIRHELTLPRDTAGGGYCITMPTGTLMPAGNYRVEVTAGVRPPAVVEFTVVPVPKPAPAPREPERLTRVPGFTVAVPASWREEPLPDIGLALVHAIPPGGVLVVERREPDETTAAEVVARATANIGQNQEYRVVSSSALCVDGRAAAAVVLDLVDGTRQKLVVIPRDRNESRVFLNAVLSARRSEFRDLEPAFDGMLSSFHVVPVPQ